MFLYSVNTLDKYMCSVQDSFEEQASQGLFVPYGRQDVLTVRAAGASVTIKQYFWIGSTNLPQFLLHPSQRTRAVDSTNQGPGGGIDHRKSDSTADGILQPDAVPALITDAITGTCTTSGA